ncbi:MAG: TRAP transporter substrate-binding protein [Bacteroidota bacterium]
MKKHFISLIALVMIVSIIAAPLASANLVLKYGHANATTYPYHLAGEAFAQKIATQSKDLSVKLYPQGQLGGERDITEGLQLGTVDLQGSSIGMTANFIPVLNILNLPFLFKSPEHFMNVMEGKPGKWILEEANKQGEKVGLKVLAIGGPMFRMPMNDVRPLETTADFKGLRIRTMEVPIHMAGYKALGSSPVPLPFGELYTALQTGVVDGNENGPATLAAQKFYEVQKYLSTLPIFTNGGIFLMSVNTWKKLSSTQQKAVMNSVQAWYDSMNEEGLKQDNEAVQLMESKGVKVTRIKDVKPFFDACKPVYDDFFAKNPQSWAKVVSDIQKMD